MAKQLKAIYENGVLRPLEPVNLEEHARVTVRISEARPAKEDNAYSHRYAEQAWLDGHSGEYRGQWVALEGPELISHGSDAIAVRDEARNKGVRHPLMVHIAEDFDQPSAGLLQL